MDAHDVTERDHRRVEDQVDIDAPVADVWDALTDPESLSAWFDADVELDVRVAGTGTVVERDGTVREVLVTDVDVDRRLAWHWWDDRGNLSSVELTLEPVVDATRVRVVEQLVAEPGGSDGVRAVACASGRRWCAGLARLQAGHVAVRA